MPDACGWRSCFGGRGEEGKADGEKKEAVRKTTARGRFTHVYCLAAVVLCPGSKDSGTFRAHLQSVECLLTWAMFAFGREMMQYDS